MSVSQQSLLGPPEACVARFCYIKWDHIWAELIQKYQGNGKPTADISCDQLVRNNNKIEIQFFCQVVIASAKRREKHK
jgi:hypothetical protein